MADPKQHPDSTAARELLSQMHRAEEGHRDAGHIDQANGWFQAIGYVEDDLPAIIAEASQLSEEAHKRIHGKHLHDRYNCESCEAVYDQARAAALVPPDPFTPSHGAQMYELGIERAWKQARAESAATIVALRDALNDVGRWIAASDGPQNIITDIERVLSDAAPAAASAKAEIERLDSFAGLKDGWDSYGAKAITPEAIATARLMLTKRPFPVPTNDGGIALEWQDENVEVTCEILPSGDTPERYSARAEIERAAVERLFTDDELTMLLAAVTVSQGEEGWPGNSDDQEALRSAERKVRALLSTPATPEGGE